MKTAFAAFLLVLLAGCSGNERFRLPVQHWKDIQITVETRPEPVQVGMNEFIVMTTDSRGVPVADLVIAIRTGQSGKWRQCIQDGHSGVYRKAIAVRHKGDALTVQLRRRDEQAEFTFPLAYQ